MDWRLIAALSAAGGSFCAVGVGAYAMLTANPAVERQSAAAPMLLSEYRFPSATAPLLESMQASQPSPFAPPSLFSPPSPFAHSGMQASSNPVMASDSAMLPGRISTTGAAPALNASRMAEDSHKLPHASSEPKRELHVAGYKTASVTPSDADTRHEPPPRPMVEIKKSTVVPELHTALPVSRYRGVLTSAEIVRIRHSLRLTPDQEPGWPSVEAALGEMGRQQIALIRQGQEPQGALPAALTAPPARLLQREWDQKP